MSEVFTGRASEMRLSEWLAVEDIRGYGDCKVTIENVIINRNVEFEGGRKVALVFSLKFVGKSRQLIINSAIRQLLVAKCGADVTDWTGHIITIYVDETVTMMGVTVGGIRIRDEVIKPKEPPE